jgi:hypothetical protein
MLLSTYQHPSMSTDPQEDDRYTSKDGNQSYLPGPVCHLKSIQRRSVDYFSIAVGDPPTSGYSSHPDKGTQRQDPSRAIPSSPSLPISYENGKPFLRALTAVVWIPLTLPMILWSTGWSAHVHMCTIARSMHRSKHRHSHYQTKVYPCKGARP